MPFYIASVLGSPKLSGALPPPTHTQNKAMLLKLFCGYKSLGGLNKHQKFLVLEVWGGPEVLLF